MTIPDFTEHELGIIQAAVNRRYRAQVRLELADADVSLNPGNSIPVTCPTVFWDQRRTSFTIFKAGESRFRCQFFGRDLEMYGTGRAEYEDLTECVQALLQAQADHERDGETGSADAIQR